MVQKLVVGALFHNATSIHHNDLIGVSHGAESMRNHQCGPIRRNAHQGTLNRCFCFIVNSGCCFIEDQNGYIFQNGSSQGNSLALSTRQTLTTFTYNRVKSLR